MFKRFVPLAAAIGGFFLAMMLATNAARAEKRVALVVGNSNYQTVPQLPNPSRDANAVAKMFRDAGFDTVDTLINAGNLEFKRAIRKFETVADQADIAVVYYAGHGLEIGGVNYLIPVDARLASDRDAEDESIPLERLVATADGAKRLRLIVLDACRDNPFAKSMRRERKTANRAVSAGLGKVEPTSTDTLIAYAAKAGSTADDGEGQHSPFTTAVLKNLTVPGLDVRLAFGRVRDEVLRSTASRQEPFVYGSLGGGNIALVPAPTVAPEAAANDIKADYELVQKIGTRRAWEVFLGTHPTGFYADLARAQIEALGRKGNVNLAALPQPPSPGREMPTKESLEWDRVKDATDPAALQRFIRRFPDSPLTVNAQQRLDVLKKAAQEREAAGPRRAGGGAQGRGGSAAPGGTAQGRTGGCEETGRRRAPRQGSGSRTKGESRRGRTQGSRSQAEGRTGRTGSRRRRSAAQRAAASGRPRRRKPNSGRRQRMPSARPMRISARPNSRPPRPGPRAKSRRGKPKRRARKLNSLSPGKLRARTNRPGSSRSRPRAVRDRASRI